MKASFDQPDKLLAAYFRSKGQTQPADDALHLLKVYAGGGFRWRNDEVRDFAHAVLQKAHFDVLDLVENFLGIDLYINDLSELDDEAGAPVFGVARPADRTIEICHRAESYEPLFRSTVMHEVAHLLKHSRRRTANREMCYSPAAKRRPPEEAEADAFMAEALLPKSVFFLAVVVVAEERGINSGEALRGGDTTRGRFQWRSFYFPFLINTLCVSRELIAVKLVRMGYIGGETFKYHRSYALTTRWRTAQPNFNFGRAVQNVANSIGL